MRDTYDVAIVGAGPGGSATAYTTLRKQGLASCCWTNLPFHVIKRAVMRSLLERYES
jgi:2-polyprenyl-6-methoxyphenol hydroxylase-like FAD-dependent oxidoreductase